MFFDDQFAQEKPLVESRLSSDSVNISIVEFWSFGCHVEVTQNMAIINELIKSMSIEKTKLNLLFFHH